MQPCERECDCHIGSARRADMLATSPTGNTGSAPGDPRLVSPHRQNARSACVPQLLVRLAPAIRTQNENREIQPRLTKSLPCPARRSSGKAIVLASIMPPPPATARHPLRAPGFYSSGDFLILALIVHLPTAIDHRFLCALLGGPIAHHVFTLRKNT
jgi:hypothetical protein